MPAALCIAASAAIIFLLGLGHLFLTFFGNRLHPRDAELRARMQAASPVISKESSMWQAWVGFNASHSFGAMLFGAIYGYLATQRTEVLLQSGFLLSVGILLLAGYVVLAKRYWFSAPFYGILLAAVLYVVGLGVSQL